MTADQVLDIVAAGHEVPRQRVEQLGVARRVRAPGVVDRVDDAASGEAAAVAEFPEQAQVVQIH